VVLSFLYFFLKKNLNEKKKEREGFLFLNEKKKRGVWRGASSPENACAFVFLKSTKRRLLLI
jgi:hypothetical protein